MQRQPRGRYPGGRKPSAKPSVPPDVRQKIAELRRQLRALEDERSHQYYPNPATPEDVEEYKEDKYQIREQIAQCQQAIRDLGGDPYKTDGSAYNWIFWAIMVLVAIWFILSRLN
jgi:hypothetical protein